MGVRVGIVVVGHGSTASELLSAAGGIVGHAALAGVIAVDAGAGETDDLCGTLCSAIERADAGRGVLLMVDLLGASPCSCGRREGSGRELVVLGGLNLAMLLKLANLDAEQCSATQLAVACADSARRAVAVDIECQGGRS
jgi:mannose/fructose-specific phosphotransferase system component IIA